VPEAQDFLSQRLRLAAELGEDLVATLRFFPVTGLLMLDPALRQPIACPHDDPPG
jgi:hypothetical protein